MIIAYIDIYNLNQPGNLWIQLECTKQFGGPQPSNKNQQKQNKQNKQTKQTNKQTNKLTN